MRQRWARLWCLTGIIWLAGGLLAWGQTGERLEFKKGELYFTDGVTKAEAERLGRQLVEGEFFNDAPKTAQISRSGDRYVFRWVVKKEYQADPEILAVSRLMGGEISLEVFGGAPVQTVICDDQMAAIKELEVMRGMSQDGGQLFFTDRVTATEAASLGSYLVREKFFGGKKKSVLLDRPAEILQFKMVTGEESTKDPALQQLAGEIAIELSNNVLDGTPVETHLCDNLFRTLLVSPVSKSFGRRLQFNGGDMFLAGGVAETEGKKLGAFLIDQGFFDGNPKSLQLAREGKIWQMRLVVQEGMEDDAEYGKAVAQFRGELQKSVFGGEPTEIHLCDNFLRGLRVFAADGVRNVGNRSPTAQPGKSPGSGTR